MKVYLDLVFLLNFFLDFLLLLTVNAILKRNVKIRRIILGGIVGSLSTFLLFFSFNSLELFFMKLIVSIFMILCTFKYHTIKELLTNLLYLYFTSILLGGFLYYLNLEFSYEVIKNVFVSNQFHLNYILIILIGPLILFIYIKQNIYQKKRNKTIYLIQLVKGKKKYQYTGYLDTGNKLYDPYSARPVHLLYDPNFKITKKDKMIYVPYHGLQSTGIIPCIFFDKMIIDNKREISKVLIGLSKEPFHIDGVSMILHEDEITEES